MKGPKAGLWALIAIVVGAGGIIAPILSECMGPAQVRGRVHLPSQRFFT
jgi:hypothetical protein